MDSDPTYVCRGTGIAAAVPCTRDLRVRPREHWRGRESLDRHSGHSTPFASFWAAQQKPGGRSRLYICKPRPSQSTFRGIQLTLRTRESLALLFVRAQARASWFEYQQHKKHCSLALLAARATSRGAAARRESNTPRKRLGGRSSRHDLLRHALRARFQRAALSSPASSATVGHFCRFGRHALGDYPGADGPRARFRCPPEAAQCHSVSRDGVGYNAGASAAHRRRSSGIACISSLPPEPLPRCVLALGRYSRS
ncbi:hypothetical protein C8R44DRAFT_761763 [Mycena epipterygia]|nr:hypothetical protein C8R44DRAFT_761763 [Mycena epipterygia]